MEHVDTDELDARTGNGGGDVRYLSDPLETDDLAINHYTLTPGENFAGGVHTHLDQEEVFYIVEGTATFEWAPDPDAERETVTVEAGEGIRFAPGEYQQGRNESEEEVVALALGAPRPSTDVRVPTACRNCGESDNLAWIPTDGGARLECPECGEGFTL